jgi:ATP-binding cassette subfamily C protein
LKPFFYFLQYLKKLYAFAPKQFILGCALTVADAFLSGFGLLLLIPLLHYAGWLPVALYQDNNWLLKIMHFLPPVHGHLPLLFTLFIFILLTAVIGSIGYFQQQIMSQLRQNYLAFLTQKLNHAVANAQWSFLLKHKLKHVEQMIATGLPQIEMLTYHSLQMISSLIVIVIFTGFSCLISFDLTLIVCFIAIGLFLILNRWKFFDTGKKIFETYRHLQEQLARFLDGIKLAKSYNQVDTYLCYFNGLNRSCRELQINFIKQRSLMRFFYLVASAIAISIIFFTGILFFKLNIITLMLLLLIFSRLLPKLSSWQQDYISAIATTPVFHQAQTMLEEFSHAQDLANPVDKISFSECLQAHHLSFSYNEKNILEDISFKIAHNTTVAIVGQSGAGKSTLADLLLGLLLPTQGKICIDNISLDAKKIYQWRELVSYVPQEAYFFNDTIRANLRWAKPDATEAQLWEALSLTAADNFVKILPDGLDTHMGDRGIHFSGGEKQRLSLARALLRNPQVLLLDEATSALDSQNEELIYQTLHNLHGKITIIIITHRYSTIRGADSVFVLDQGKLVETGKPSELLAIENSFFSRLFYSQTVN